MVKTKILAMILALAMVMAVVPAFTLTASAAEVTTVSSTIENANVVWTMPSEGLNKDDPITKLEGWSAETLFGNGNISNESEPTKGNYIQFFGQSGSSSGPNVTLRTPGYGDAADTLIIEAMFKTSGGDTTFYQKHTFYDIDGKEIGHAWFDVNQKDFIKENPWGYPSNNDEIALVVENNKVDGTHTNKWYVKGDLKFTDENIEGVINGLGSITVNSGGVKGNDQWYWHMGYRNLTVAAVMPESTETVTAKYTVEGKEVASVKRTYDKDVYPEGFPFPARYYSADGSSSLYYAPETPVASGEQDIQMSVTTNADVAGYSNGSGIASGGENYVIVSDNIIPNGDFKGGLAGWFDGSNSGENAVPILSTFFTVKDDGTIVANKHEGNTGVGSLYRTWPIENGKTYAFTLFDSVSNNFHVLSLSNSQGQETADDKGIFGTEMANVQTKPSVNAAAGQQNVFVFTNDDNYQYAKVRFRWNGPGNIFGNFGLYEVKKITEVAEPIDVTSAVIEGNAPVLPDTVTVNVDGEDAARTVPVVWSEAELKAGEEPVTLTATVKGTELAAGSAKVTVLPCTDDSLAGVINSTNKNDAAANNTHHLFNPAAGTIKFEYDFTVKDTSKINSDGTAGNFGIFIGHADGATPPAYTADGNAIGLQGVFANKDPNTFAFKNGDGSGKATASESFKIDLNKTYRVFIEANTEAVNDGKNTKGSYTAKIYKPDGTLLREETSPLAFRKEVSDLNALVVSTNGSGTADGNIVVENFRVSWTEGGTEYTVKAQCDGEDIEGFEPEKQRVVSENNLKAPVIDGYALIDDAPTVSGEEEKTATYNYKAGALKNAFSFNFKNNAVEPAPKWEGANGGRIVFNSNNGIVGGIMIFDAPAPAPEGEKLAGAKLTIRTMKSDNGNQKKTQIYVIPASKVNEENTSLVGEYTNENWKEMTEAVLVSGTTTFGPAQSAQYKEMSLDLSKVNVDSDKLAVLLIETTSNNRYYIAGPEMAAKTYIEYEYAKVPGDLTAKLGWHNGKFTIDYVLADGEQNATAIEVQPEGADSVISGEITEGATGLAFSTENTNRIYTAVAKNGNVEGKPVENSIYALVMQAVADIAESGNTIAEDQVEAVNTVLNNGGLFITEDGNLTTEAALVMSIEGNVVTLKPEVVAAGLAFSDGIKTGDTLYDTAKVNEDGTVTLSNSATGASVDGVMLEEIEFVFEPDEVTDSADYSGEIDFIEVI